MPWTVRRGKNEQRLLELCTYHDLCIANSYFRTKPQHKVYWRHPLSKHWHQLDLILFGRAALKNVLYTHARTTVRIATQTTPWCVARTDCTQRGSIALGNRGTPVLRSARCHSQTLCHNLLRLLRKSLMPHSPKFLPQKSGKFSETAHRPDGVQTVTKAKEICRFSDLPGARFTKPRDDVQMSIGHSSARIYRHPPKQGTSGECT